MKQTYMTWKCVTLVKSAASHLTTNGAVLITTVTEIIDHPRVGVHCDVQVDRPIGVWMLTFVGEAEHSLNRGTLVKVANRSFAGMS